MNAPPVRVLEPPRGLGGSRLREVWRARELLVFLARRDLKVRYTQALMGSAWAVLQPVLMMAVFTFFFGHLAHVPSDGFPYAVFVLCGTVPWTFFSNSVSINAESLTRNSALVSKVYFPRLVVPLAAVLSWVPDLLVASAVLGGFVLAYGIVPGWALLLLPVFAVLAVATAGAVSIWTSALNVAYRDVRFAIPFLLQLWFFVTPVIYSTRLVTPEYRWLFGLNPMATVVQGFRWTFLGDAAPPPAMLALSVLVLALLLVTGVVYFRRVEQFFADLI